jgi:hypothetical protein
MVVSSRLAFLLDTHRMAFSNSSALATGASPEQPPGQIPSGGVIIRPQWGFYDHVRLNPMFADERPLG